MKNLSWVVLIMFFSVFAYANPSSSLPLNSLKKPVKTKIDKIRTTVVKFESFLTASSLVTIDARYRLLLLDWKKTK